MEPKGWGNSDELRRRLHVLRDATCPTGCSHRTGAGCALIPASRAVCTYVSGPEGWSRFAGDPDIKPESNPALEFIGVKQTVFARRRATLDFILVHELEHERQRFCQNRVGPGLMREIRNELGANRAAWRYLHHNRRIGVSTYVAAVLFWIGPISVLGPLLGRNEILGYLFVMSLFFMPTVLWDVTFGLPILGVPAAPGWLFGMLGAGFLWAHVARDRSR